MMRSFKPSQYKNGKLTGRLLEGSDTSNLIREVYGLMTDDNCVDVIDVPSDGSCLFHAAFGSVWFRMTGDVVHPCRCNDLTKVWESSRIYGFREAFDKFNTCRQEAVMGAVWKACTHMMRLFVAATWCFGAPVLDATTVKRLLLSDNTEQEKNYECRDAYLVAMWRTLLESTVLIKSSIFLSDAEDSEEDLSLTMAMAAQHLLDRANHYAAQLRKAIIKRHFEGKECSCDVEGDTAEETVALKAQYQDYVRQEYENAWFVSDEREKMKWASLALTYDCEPTYLHLYKQSRWANIFACQPLAVALGTNIYVLVPEVFKADPVTRLQEFCTLEEDAPSIYLYMLGNGDHFGYAVEQHSAHSKVPLYNFNALTCRNVILSMCCDFLDDHRLDVVPHVFDLLKRWHRAIDCMGVHENILVSDPSTKENALSKRVRWTTHRYVGGEPQHNSRILKVLTDHDVVQRAWNSKTLLDNDKEDSLGFFIQEQESNKKKKNVSLLNEHVSTASELMESFTEAVRTLGELKKTLVGTKRKPGLLGQLPKGIILEAGMQRLDRLKKNAMTASFNDLAQQVNDDIGFLIEHTSFELQRKVAPVVEKANEFYTSVFEPLFLSVRRSSEACIRYVLARMHHSVAQPHVVPLYIMGEQLLFYNNASKDLQHDVSASDLEIYQLRQDFESCTAEQVVSGEMIEQLVVGKQPQDELVAFLCEFVYNVALCAEKPEDLNYTLPFATGFKYSNATVADMKEKKDIPQQEKSNRVHCKAKIGIHALTLVNPASFSSDLTTTGNNPSNDCQCFFHVEPSRVSFHTNERLSGKVELEERLRVLRFYALYNEFSVEKRFFPMILQGKEMHAFVQGIDASILLSPMYRLDDQGMEAEKNLLGFKKRNEIPCGFYGDSPTDSLFNESLSAFFDENTKKGQQENEFETGIELPGSGCKRFLTEEEI